VQREIALNVEPSPNQIVDGPSNAQPVDVVLIIGCGSRHGAQENRRLARPFGAQDELTALLEQPKPIDFAIRAGPFAEESRAL
jgi:hypothetical protein